MQRKNILFLLIITVVIIIANICGCINFDNTGGNAITIKGKDGTFFTIMDAINEASEGDTILVSKGVYNETLTIDKSITLTGSDKDNTIISGNKTGDVIYITADYVNISGFTIKNSGEKYSQGADAGLEIKSNNNMISDNNISSNDNYGLYITTGSKNNKIINNKFSKNRYGIYINNGNQNDISSNNFLLNTDYGMYLGSQSNYNSISDNVFSENQYGIRIKSSDNNEVTQNLFLNGRRGVYLCCGAKYNTVYLNDFKNNSEWNARDGSINQWDKGNLGNYWDDYNGKDNNGDRIGDIPHVLPSADNSDKYPLIFPYENYI
jgi:parallel beta-helix repeat protein